MVECWVSGSGFHQSLNRKKGYFSKARQPDKVKNDRHSDGNYSDSHVEFVEVILNIDEEDEGVD